MHLCILKNCTKTEATTFLRKERVLGRLAEGFDHWNQTPLDSVIVMCIDGILCLVY